MDMKKWLKRNWKYVLVGFIFLFVTSGLAFFYWQRLQPKETPRSPGSIVDVDEFKLRQKDSLVDSTFIVYGDSRTNHEEHQTIVDAILELEPKVVFHTGDLVENGNDPDLWATFNEITKDLRDSADFYPAIGNHENNSQLYFDNFELPNNERWYSVEIHEDIEFIILDSTSDLSLSSDQYHWLMHTLHDMPEDSFIAVLFHHPLYSTGAHEEDEMNIRQYLEPLFDQYDVDIVFSGHDHCYERLLVNDIYYVISGGGGAPLYDQTRTSEFSQKYIKDYHFCVITFGYDFASVQVYDKDKMLLDSFEVEF